MPIDGESVKTEDLRNSWFTVNHVNAFTSFLANQIEKPIRCKQRDQASAIAPSPPTHEENFKSIAKSLITNPQATSSVNEMAKQNDASSSFEEI